MHTSQLLPGSQNDKGRLVMDDTRHRYQEEVQKFELQVTRVTEHVLKEQERLRRSALEEFNQTISQLLSEHDNFSLAGQCDPATIGGSLIHLNEWVENLKQLHLELESVDNFLRNIIPADQKWSDLDEFDETKCSELQIEVSDLRDVRISKLDQEISLLQSEVNESCDGTLKLNETIKETCLEVSQDIDQCWKLLDDIECLQSKSLDSESSELDPIRTTYNQWKWNQLAESESEYLNEQLKVLTETKLKLEKLIAKKADIKTPPEIIQKYSVYQLITELWNSKLISGLFPNIKNLEVFPQSGKLQFEIDSIEVLLTIHKENIKAIRLFSHELSFEQIDSLKEDIGSKINGVGSLFEMLQVISDCIVQLKPVINT